LSAPYDEALLTALAQEAPVSINGRHPGGHVLARGQRPLGA
jgi:hypothetical protein